MTKKALGLADYQKLAQDQQFEILHRDGVYVGKRRVGGQTVVLFQLYGFYAEVFYRQYRRQVDRTLATDNADVLQPYLDQINIRGLDEKKDAG